LGTRSTTLNPILGLDVIDCDARQNYYPAGVAIVVEKRCMKTERKSGLSRIVSIFTENFGLSWSLSLVVVCFISLVTCFAVYWFIHSAPPRILTITSGPPGSTFERNAGKYRAILARNGVTLNIIPSQGSLENLQRLESPTSRVDVGFVQGGVADGTNTLNLISLGNIAYEPLLIFYRGGTNVRLLSGLAGKRLAIGSEGSGAHSLALTLLQTNGLWQVRRSEQE
jgi:TRAP-type uncharacterized transport system substrate-binding protein